MQRDAATAAMSDSQRMRERAAELESACAHRKVEYRRIENDNNTCSDSWRCLDCGAYFWPGLSPITARAIQAEASSAAWQVAAQGIEWLSQQYILNLNTNKTDGINVGREIQAKAEEIRALTPQAAQDWLARHDAEIQDQCAEMLMDECRSYNADASAASKRGLHARSAEMEMFGDLCQRMACKFRARVVAAPGEETTNVKA